MNSHNPHVIPGQYNPQAQAKTEAGDYLSVMFEGYVDPTQVPMRPGDTQIPMYKEKLPEAPPHQPTHPEAPEEYRRTVEAQYQQQSMRRSLLNSTTLPQSVNSESRISTVTIPIVIELTINLKINHG